METECEDNSVTHTYTPLQCKIESYGHLRSTSLGKVYIWSHKDGAMSIAQGPGSQQWLWNSKQQ